MSGEGAWLRPTAGPAPARLRAIGHGIVAGVCAGLGRRLASTRCSCGSAFRATTLASGIGIVAYALAWIVFPRTRTRRSASPRAPAAPRRRLEVASAWAALARRLLAFRELGLPFSDAVVWPLVLVAAGGALIWRQSLGGPAAAIEPRRPPRRARRARRAAGTARRRRAEGASRARR